MLGCTQWLLFHLWKKDPETMRGCQVARLPRTVIFKEGQPYVEYRWEADEIRRVARDQLDVAELAKEYCSNGQVALILRTNRLSYQDTNCQKLLYDYCTGQRLEKFLSCSSASSFLIQQVIQPPCHYSFTVRADWTPAMCVMTKRANNNGLQQRHIPQQRRLVTFQGNYIDTKETAMSPIVSKLIEEIAQGMDEHIRKVSGGCIKMKRMVLYFKVNKQNQIKLLFCSDIKVEEKGRSSLSKLYKETAPCIHASTKNDVERESIHIPDMFCRKNLQAYCLKQELNIENIEYCLKCDRKLHDRCLIAMDHIVESARQGRLKDTAKPMAFQKMINDAKKQPMFSPAKPFKTFQDQIKWLCQQFNLEQNRIMLKEIENIPLIMIKIFGWMDEKTYLNLQRRQDWKNLEVPVCQDCFIQLTGYLVEARTTKLYNSNQELNTFFKSLLSKTTLENIEGKVRTRKRIEQARPKTTVRIKAHRTITAAYEPKKNQIVVEQKTHRITENSSSKIEKAYLGKRSRRFQADTTCTEHSFAMSTINKIREVSHLLS